MTVANKNARPVRAIIYGVGEMGAIVTRLLVERGVDIVGAIGRSKSKVGRDLGDVAGLGTSLGVKVEADAKAVLARGADIAIVCVGSYLENMQGHFAACLENRVNVVTIEEETVFPWTSAPVLAQKLDAMAKANGVTLAASGAQDVFWLNLVTTLLGASHKIDRVEGHSVWNVDDYGPEVARHLCIGMPRAEFERHVADNGWPEFVARQTLEAMVSRLGLSAADISSTVLPIVADVPIACRALGTEVAVGSLIGTMDTTTLRTVEGPQFEFRMAGRIHQEGESDSNTWRVHGEPDLHLQNDNVPTRFITCSTMVNRIVDVIKAPPGLISLDMLSSPSLRSHLIV
ncbi:hypothetical protein [uncultured Ruegeria sp.]|uniref:NAD(P)H-dependent amine dehydrogenase family protein n=1 Tax=uncultured Ruegeria sp. TaxID=259304 RepID=UPI00261D9063|nr:hypothetical protein [uncultured Ruegeria sp.]